MGKEKEDQMLPVCSKFKFGIKKKQKNIQFRILPLKLTLSLTLNLTLTITLNLILNLTMNLKPKPELDPNSIS